MGWGWRAYTDARGKDGLEVVSGRGLQFLVRKVLPKTTLKTI